MSSLPAAELRKFFQLDFSVHFLNHGSFGACPLPVFEVYQDWQCRLERQPVEFLARDLADYMKEARTALAVYFKASKEDLVFIPNATHGVNIIARSLKFAPGDEILTTDHEYGACDYVWEFIANKTGATIVKQSIQLPITSREAIVDQLWSGVTPNTRLIFLSHITSPTAMCLPVEEICARARREGILTLVDGAHAPGQIPVDLPAINADFYIGNCHKWMLSPKGAGFLYARAEAQNLVEPLVVSWGYHASAETTTGSRFLDFFGWSGTQDPAAYLAVPSAIQFLQDHSWDQVQKRCHEMLRQTLQKISMLTDMEPFYPLESNLYHQMGIAPLPPSIETISLQKRLYAEYRVEIPLIDWNGRNLLRISVQGYNTSDDLEALTDGLEKLLPVVAADRLSSLS